MWDTGGWELNKANPDVKFIAPKSGALGWVDTFAIPAKGRNDAAAYAWINFNMRPEIAAKVAGAAGNFTASKGADQLMGAGRPELRPLLANALQLLEIERAMVVSGEDGLGAARAPPRRRKASKTRRCRR
mgnify:CR=1 FL=1